MARQEFSVPNLMARMTDEAAAYEFLEELRWDGQPACPHCGSIAAHYFLTPANGKDRATRTGAPSQRRVWKCKDCRKQFSVLTGTVMHGTKISVRTWVMVLLEMCASKNGVSAREIERKYDLTAKSAWFLLQRIREAMKRDPLAGLLSGTIIADETWVGGKDSNRHAGKRRRPGMGHTDKKSVMVLVDYETRESRARVIRNVTGETLGRVLSDEVEIKTSQLWTDESASYRTIGKPFGDHKTVNHSEGGYKRDGASTNIAASRRATSRSSSAASTVRTTV